MQSWSVDRKDWLGQSRTMSNEQVDAKVMARILPREICSLLLYQEWFTTRQSVIDKAVDLGLIHQGYMTLNYVLTYYGKEVLAELQSEVAR